MPAECFDEEELAQYVDECPQRSLLPLNYFWTLNETNAIQQGTNRRDAIIAFIRCRQIFKQYDANYPRIVVMNTLALEPNVAPFEYVAEAVKRVVIADVVHCRSTFSHLHFLDFLQLQRGGSA